jgi:hypothetical protein
MLVGSDWKIFEDVLTPLPFIGLDTNAPVFGKDPHDPSVNGNTKGIADNKQSNNWDFTFLNNIVNRFRLHLQTVALI